MSMNVKLRILAQRLSLVSIYMVDTNAVFLMNVMKVTAEQLILGRQLTKKFFLIKIFVKLYKKILVAVKCFKYLFQNLISCAS